MFYRFNVYTMRQFVVPQFIDVEDKIIGPITVRQFIILIIGGLFVFIEYKLSDMTMFLAVGIPTILVFGVVAFLRVNSMPFHYFFLNFVTTLKEPKIRVWSRETKFIFQKTPQTQKEAKSAAPLVRKEIVLNSKLTELSLIVDTGGVYEGEKSQQEYSFKK